MELLAIRYYMDVKSCNDLKKHLKSFIKKNHGVVLNLWILVIFMWFHVEFCLWGILLSEAHHIHFRECIQIQFIAHQATEVLINVARSDSARRRSNLTTGHKWKKTFMVFFVIWCNEKCRTMLRLPATLRNESSCPSSKNFITVLVTCPKCFPLPINIAFTVPKFSSASCS